MKAANHLYTRATFLGLVCLLSNLSACKQEPELPDPAWYVCDNSALGALDDHPHAERYQKLIDEALALGSPAVSATVISPEGMWVGAGGQGDILQNIAAEPCQKYYVGSISKLFAAATILRLIEEGKLALNDLARDHLPADVISEVANLSITEPSQGVTIKNLMQHTSGIPDYVHVDYLTTAFNGGLHGADATAELEWIYGKSALFAPGSDFQYSNTNYLLLSLIIAELTGDSSYNAVHNYVTNPLNLNNTLGRSEEPNAVVRGYGELHGNGVLLDHTEITEGVMYGADKLDGGFVSTTSDVARLLRSFAKGDLLQAETWQQMQEFRDYGEGENSGPENGYGLGLARINTAYGEAWGHYGTVYPFSSLAFHFPDHELTVVLSVNGFVSGMGAWGNSEAPFDLLFE